VNQTVVKTPEISPARDTSYHMIPIDRKEQNRQDIEQVDDKEMNSEPQLEKERVTTITEDNNNQETIDDKVPVLIKPEVNEADNTNDV
jgi:hypothetical protein